MLSVDGRLTPQARSKPVPRTIRSGNVPAFPSIQRYSMTQKTHLLPQTACHICQKIFTPKTSYHINCTEKCAYISRHILLPAAENMTRNEAIEYYGALYEVPLRRYIRSRHRPLLQVLWNFCEQHNTTTFTQRDINEFTDLDMHSQSLAVCARNIPAVRKTGDRIPGGHGKFVVEWQFCKEAL